LASKRLVSSNDKTTTQSSDKATNAGDEKKDIPWFSRLIVRSIESSKEQHSSLLSDKDTVYEIQFHSVKPECMENYVNEYKTLKQIVAGCNTGAELSASFTVEVGDPDEAVHIWKFAGGYPGLDKHKSILRQNKDFLEFRRRRNPMLRSRQNQILLAFSFWPEIAARSGPNIYELRSYRLKPGTMIEWGNCWVRGLKHRRQTNEAVAGYFSHIGNLYQVYHLWCYKSLEDRNEVRDNVWSQPEWGECVSMTVPLMQRLQSRLLIPMSFSPLQ
jgi:hypothetical protein